MTPHLGNIPFSKDKTAHSLSSNPNMTGSEFSDRFLFSYFWLFTETGVISQVNSLSYIYSGIYV